MKQFSLIVNCNNAAELYYALAAAAQIVNAEREKVDALPVDQEMLIATPRSGNALLDRLA